MGSIGLLVVFALGMAAGSSAWVTQKSYEPKQMEEDGRNRQIFQNLEPVVKMYVAMTQQIKLDQEKVDKQIAHKEAALQMAAKQLAEIQQKLMETKRRLSGCPPQQFSNIEAAPGFDIMPPYTR